MGAEKYDYLSRFNGKPARAGVKLASGANEMATAGWCSIVSTSWRSIFHHGLEYKVAYETTSFVKASIEDVVKTLLEAIAGFPRYVSVPAKLPRHADTHYRRAGGVDGNLLRAYAFGYSVNTLTMFAMVLAIGLLVDDAIVVVENVERIMSEEGLTAKPRKSMGQIRGHWSGLRWCFRRYLCQWLLRRHHRCHLSPVLYYHCCGDGAVSTGSDDPHSCSVCHAT